MIADALLHPIPGWDLNVEERTYTIAWQSEKTHHEIKVGDTVSGWTYVWVRYPTLTIAEAGPFKSVDEAMRSLWIEVLAMADRNHDLLVAEARRSLEAAT